MQHNYRDPATGGLLSLAIGETEIARQFFHDRANPLLSIGWNVGTAQSVWVDEVPMQLPANAVVTLMVSQTYRFDRPQDIVLWRFNRDFYCIVDHDREVSCVGLLFYGSHGSAVLPLSADDARRVESLLTVFEDEFETRDTIQGEMLRTLLKRLIILLTRVARTAEVSDKFSPPQLDLVRRFNLLVEQNYRSLHRVSGYASLLNKSPKTLANLFASHTDVTPQQVIHLRIATEAKRLLLYTDKSAKQVSGELGFPDPASFSRFFKGVVGASPHEFRSSRGGFVTLET